MKKKNLLTLGALCLSLGLVVSSCNNTSVPGEPGKPGEDGQPGKDGVDGKTFVPIIVVNDLNIKGGTIDQDVYFAVQGEHDKVTFTFTAQNEGNVITYFEINGEEVSIAPDATSYTVEDIDTSYPNGIQVTGLTYQSLDAYAETGVKDFFKTISDADNQVKNGTEPEGLVKSAYYDVTLEKLVDDKVTEVKKAYTDLDKDATVTEKVEAIKTATEKAKAEIQEAYDNLVTAAKNTAKTALKTLDESLVNSNYTEADRKTVLDTANAEVDAATSLQGLAAIVNTATANPKGAKYNKLFALKAQAFAEIKSAVEATGSFEKDVETNKDILADYGITADSKPSEIAKTYYAQASAATEITTVEVEENGVKTTLTSIGKEAKEAIEASVENVKGTLLANIKAAYIAEVDNSKVLADAQNAASTIKGVIEATVSNFKVQADKEPSKYGIAVYVSTNGTKDHTAKDYDETDGLIYRLEKAVTEAVVANGVQAFNSERIENAKQAAIASFQEKVDEIKAADAGYVEAVSYTKDSSGKITPKKTSWVLATVEETNVTLDTPFFTPNGQGEEKTWSLKHPEGLVEKVDDVKDLTDYNVDTWLTTLKGATLSSPLDVKQFESTHIGDFEKIYDKAIELLTESLRTKLALGDIEGEYISSDDVLTSFNNSVKDKTLNEIIKVGQSTYASKELLTKLNDAVEEDVAARVEKDSAYEALFGSEQTSVYREELGNLVDSLVSGQAGESEVNAFIEEDNLNSLYAQDVATYLEDAKDVLTQVYQNTISGNDVSVDEYRTLTKLFNDFSSWAGHKLTQTEDGWVIDENGTYERYLCNTINSVETWLDDARKALSSVLGEGDPVTGPTTVEVSVDESYTTDSYDGATWTQSKDLKFSEPVLEVGKSAEINVTGTAIVQGEEAGFNSFWGVENADGSKVYLLELTLPQGTTVRTGYKLTNDGKALGAVKDDGVNSIKEFTIDSTGSISFVVAAGDIGTLEYGERNLQVDVYDGEGYLVGSYYFDASALK